VKQKRPIREKQITGKVPTWEQVFDAIPDSVALISPSFELLKANKAMRKFLDIPFGKELKGKCRDLMKKICRSKVCPVKALRKKKKRCISEIEIEGRCYRVNIDPVFSGKQLSGMTHTITDITGLKKSQAESERFFAMTSVLRRVDQTLMLKRNSAALYKDICNAIIKSGFIRFVWIGIADREKQEIAPAACAGSSKWYIDNLYIKYDNSRYGSGPTGIAIKTNSTVVANDLSTNKLFSPWRARAGKAGFASSLAVPIIHKKVVIGSLNVYSGIKDCFGRNEVLFFEELASNIGLGLYTIEKESESRRLADFYRQSAIPVIEIDDSGRTVFANQNAGKHFKEIETLGIKHPVFQALQASKNEQRPASHGGEFEGRYYLANSYRSRESGTIRYYFLDVTQRKKTEEKLKLTENRFRRLFDNMVMAVVRCKIIYKRGEAVDFLHLETNKAYHKITGFGAVIGKSMNDVSPGIWKQDAPLLEACARVARTGKSEHFEMFIAGLNSWYNISLTSVERGTFVAAFDNITTRVKSEFALKESEARFKSLFEASPEAISVTDLSGRELMTNRMYCSLFGKSAGRKPDERTAEFVVEKYFADEDKARANEDRKRTLSTGKSSLSLYTVVRKDGTRIKIEVTRAVLRDTKRSVVGLITVFRDVTVKQNQEEKIRRSEAMYKLLAENTGDVVWVLDNELRYTYVSPSFLASRGIKPESVIGRSIEDYCDEKSYQDMKKATSELREAALAGNTRALTTRILESRLRTAEGAYIIGEVTLNIILDKQGKPIGFNGATRDITERRKLEANLIQAQKLETIGQLAAGVSHEFNNLLTIIQLSAEEAMLVGTKEAYERMAGTVVETTSQASTIARRLNDFARKQKMEKHPVDVVKCMDKAVEMIEAQYSKQGIKITREFAEVPSTLTDDKLLLQVFINLLKNAQQAMPSGGTITAQVSYSDGNIYASVADTGTGIKKENLEKIFTPFFTTKSATGSGGQHGVGLGLAVSYSIVKGLGGGIRVESEEGKGAKFTASIPVVLKKADELSAPSIKDLPPTRGGRILVVDDEKPILGLMKTILGASGYAVETAENGKDALLALENFKADVILLDMVLPGTNLETLLGYLYSRFPGIRVIVVTGLGDEEMSNWQPVLQKFGVCGVVLKPFDFSRLKLEIDKCLIPRAR